jgi:hypothetical protein
MIFGFVKVFIDDIWGFNQALLNYTDDTPSGSSEADGASQRLDSILKIVSNINTINTTQSFTIEKFNKHGILICGVGVGTVTLSAGTGTDQTNRVLVYNQAGATISVVTGGVNDFILDGDMIEYIYDGSSAWVRIVPNQKLLSQKLDTDSDYTILDNDGYDYFEQTKTTASGTSTYTLPAAANNTGRVLYFKLNQNSTGFADYLIIDGNGAETIDGETVFHMNGDNDYLTIVSNGTEWKKITFQASYVTNGNSFTDRTDYTNSRPGSNTTLNSNSNVTHNLNVNTTNLDIQFLYSSDGTENNTQQIDAHSMRTSTPQEFGLSPFQVDQNNFFINTAINGLRPIGSSGSSTTITTGFYKIIAKRKK